MRTWLQEWWPLGLAFADIGCMIRVMVLHDRAAEALWANWGMVFGLTFLGVVWWREFTDMRARHKRIWEEMEERHQREWAAFDEKWGERGD